MGTCSPWMRSRGSFMSTRVPCARPRGMAYCVSSCRRVPCSDDQFVLRRVVMDLRLERSILVRDTVDCGHPELRRLELRFRVITPHASSVCACGCI